MLETFGVLLTTELSAASYQVIVPPEQPLAESVTVPEVQTVAGVANGDVGAVGGVGSIKVLVILSILVQPPFVIEKPL